VSYAFVEDIAASWEEYGRFAAALEEGPAPKGLLLHAAGPTDEGIRIVEVWESEEAWAAFLDARPAEPDDTRPHPSSVRRELHPRHVVVGERTSGGRDEEGVTSSETGGPT
jgi:hypothetical protein